MRLNPALRKFWTTRARNKILKGGRASSKSHDAAGFAVYLAANYSLKFLCVRQIQNKISDSVYSLLKIKIEEAGMQDEFTIIQNSIRHNTTGSEFMFYGLWRNPDEIKSIEGVDILWSEESHGLTKEQWEILEPTIRKEGSECWIIFNPNLVTDFVYKRFIINPPPDTIIRHINYDENPFLSSTMLKIIEASRAEDEDEYNHIYLGYPKQENENSLIKQKWLRACIDAHKKLGIDPKGKDFIGYDIADSGGDKNAIAHRKGILLEHIEQWSGKEDELDKSHIKTYQYAMEHNAIIHYDSIGVGAGAGSKFRELNEINSGKVNYQKFNAGGKVIEENRIYKNTQTTNGDMFSNLKAQVWWDIADRVRDTYNAVTKGLPIDENDIISISSEIELVDELIIELSSPLKDTDKAGRVKVESKDDLLKRGIKSPNLADSFVMSFAKVGNKANLFASMI
jgi:phage terminase large subunit